MLEFIDGFTTRLQCNLNTTQDVLLICTNGAKQLDTLQEGNHVYLTISYLDRYEVVKFVKDGKVSGNRINVTRDILSKGRKNFPKGTCVTIDLNSVQLTEFIKQVKG